MSALRWSEAPNGALLDRTGLFQRSGHVFFHFSGVLVQAQFSGVVHGGLAPDSGIATSESESTRFTARARRIMQGALVGAALLSASAAFATTYGYDLINVPGAEQTLQVGLNDAGMVVGNWVDSRHFTHGYVYENGKITSFDVPGSISTLANGVNNAGTIVGSYQDASFTEHGFILKNGTYTTLDVPGASFTSLGAINDEEQITAAAGVPKSRVFNYLYKDGAFTGIPGSSSKDFPIAINNAGVVVGTTYVYADGKTKRIKIPNAGFVNATGINSAGAVVGYYFNTVTSTVHGFVLANGAVKDIVQPGYDETFSMAINASNVVAGYSTDKNVSLSDGFTVKKKVFAQVVPGAMTFTQSINRTGQVAGTIGGAAFLGSPQAGSN